MTTWIGWQSELLTFAHVPDNAANRAFLSDWHSRAETNCRNNPLDLTSQELNSTDCHSLPGLIAKAQNYTTPGNAAHAFNVQLHEPAFKDLLAAFESGDPLTVNDSGAVSQELTMWGSQAFAQWYFNATAGQRGGGPAVSDGDALKGWNDLRRSINRNMTKALRHSDQQMNRALHSLSRARRVKL